MRRGWARSCPLLQNGARGNERDGGSAKDSLTEALYMTSHTFEDFGKQVQLFTGAPEDPSGRFQSAGSEDEDALEEARYKQ